MTIIDPKKWKPIDIESLEKRAENVVRNSCDNTLVTAGPGAGKTELLAQKACFLLQTGACGRHNKILAISFKKDAAKNLRERVLERGGREFSSQFESLTFDAFAKSLLDRFLSGLPETYRVNKNYEIDFTLGRVQEIEDSIRAIIGKTEVDKKFLYEIDFRNFEREYLCGTCLPINEESNENIIAGALWQYFLFYHNPSKLSFSMIMRLSEYILNTNPLLLKSLRLTYKYLFLDEFQDTTSIQYDFVKTCFLGSRTLVTAVGDSKQRIMGWAGALQNSFETCREDFKCKEVQLINNYRSVPKLVNIQNNIALYIEENGIPSQSKRSVDFEEGFCCVYKYNNYFDEAKDISNRIKSILCSDNIHPRDICIIVRQTPDQICSNLIGELSKFEVQARIENDYQDLFTEPIIELIIATLSIALCGKVPEYWQILDDYFQRVLSNFEDDSFDTTPYIQNLKENCVNVVKQNQNLTRVSIGNIVIAILGLLEVPNIQSLYPQYQEDRDWKNHVTKFIDLFEGNLKKNWKKSLLSFIGKDSVPIMTLHKSKGLEFHTVIFIGLEDQQLWGFRRNPEEETSGFFVAFSRAINTMIFTLSLKRNNRFGNIETRTTRDLEPLYRLLLESGVKVIPVATI